MTFHEDGWYESQDSDEEILGVPHIKLPSLLSSRNQTYEGGPKNNRNLNVARELEVIARCVARCRESTQYSSSLPRGVSLG
jgi:hypothetical protein